VTRTCLWTNPAAICLTPQSGVATPGLPGVARPHLRRCDETEELGWP